LISRKVDEMLRMFIGTLIRHTLTVAGTTLATTGIATADDVTTAAGAATTLVSIGMSAYQKFKLHKRKGS